MEQNYLINHSLNIILWIYQHQKKNANIIFIQADITKPLTEQQITPFDFVYTKDTFEHILDPWNTTDNILNLLNENGIFIFMAPFSWLYHPMPYDTYRYSHTAVRYLFERNGGLIHLVSGYIKFSPRNGIYINGKDKTIDGNDFMECQKTFYIGMRHKNHIFDINTLDTYIN